MEMKQLEQFLHCPICYEYYQTSMMIVHCSHNFCSLCIRRYLEFEQICPICRKPTQTTDLKSNRILDEITRCFKEQKSEIPKNLKKSLSDQDKMVNGKDIEKETQNESQQTNSNPHSPTNPNSNVIENQTQNQIKVDQTIQNIIPDNNQGKEKEKEETLKIVDCPICSNKVEMEKINEHIDSGCQKMIVPNVQNSNPSTAHHTSFFSPSSDTLQKNAYFQAQKPIDEKIEKRKPLAKLCYNLLNDKQLRKTLKDYNLNTSGDRSTLIWRLKEFTLRYNSDCDSINPKNIEDYVKEVEIAEKALQNQKKKQKNLFAPSESSSSSSPENHPNGIVSVEGNEKYLVEHKSDFDKLIESVKNRMKSKEKKQNEEELNSKPEEKEIQDTSNQLNEPIINILDDSIELIEENNKEFRKENPSNSNLDSQNQLEKKEPNESIVNEKKRKFEEIEDFPASPNSETEETKSLRRSTRLQK